MSTRVISKGLLALAFAAWILFAPAAMADGAGNGIVDSPHDFAGEFFEFRDEICRICHVPHDHGRDTGLVGLLWNHELSAATYTMYSSSSLDGAQDAQPTGISKMCLGCHDGTVALDSYDSRTGAGTAGTLEDEYGPSFVVPQLQDGTNKDLRATHPISIVYAGGSDPGLNPQSTAMGSSGTISDVLENGKIQCHSCHDVHDSPGESVPSTHLLRVAQTTAGDESALCLTCHNK